MKISEGSKTTVKPYWEMNQEELEEATQEFDREIEPDTFHPLGPEKQRIWKRLQQGRKPAKARPQSRNAGGAAQEPKPVTATRSEDAEDERVTRLKTPEECEQFALNVRTRLPELAQKARRKAVLLRAAAHSAKREVEREALEAIYAYEAALFKRHGKRVRASRIWQLVEKHGIVGAVERAVNRPNDASGYLALAELGLLDLSFEAVVLRHPKLFSSKAMARSSKRLKEFQN